MIDDYGHHLGCKKAVDEYFKNKKFGCIGLIIYGTDY